MKKFIFFTILSILLNTNSLKAEESTVTISKITDGDTVRVILNGREEKVRLLHIDCYETSKNKRALWQSKHYHLPLGEVLKRGNYAKQQLKYILSNYDSVKLSWEKRDLYGRILGELYTPLDNTSINELMLTVGLCEKYKPRR
jgi:micrococcal nuclease